MRPWFQLFSLHVTKIPEILKYCAGDRLYKFILLNSPKQWI